MENDWLDPAFAVTDAVQVRLPLVSVVQFGELGAMGTVVVAPPACAKTSEFEAGDTYAGRLRWLGVRAGGITSVSCTDAFPPGAALGRLAGSKEGD